MDTARRYEDIRFELEGSDGSFSTNLEEGRYRLRVELGSASQAGATAVRAESRRFLLESIQTPAGHFEIRDLSVDVRDYHLPPPEPNAPGGSAVLLGERERVSPAWDDALTVEFAGANPTVRALTITRADQLPAIFLVGDSTVADQLDTSYASWGQMLPLFLSAEVVVSNHAQSGQTLKSFLADLRFAKVLDRMRAGDYLFIQFCHNDQKAQWPQTFAEARSTYPAYLRVYIAEARLRGATPVLVTPPQRRRFDSSGLIENTHGEYLDTLRRLAESEAVPLIDLEPMSRSFYEALGPISSIAAFAPGDATHHSAYGAYELAKCVALGISRSELPLALLIRNDILSFDPTLPDSSEEVASRLGL